MAAGSGFIYININGCRRAGLCPPYAAVFTNVINWLVCTTIVHRYDLHPRHATNEAPARGSKAASAPYTMGRLLIVAAVAVAALAAVGMSETAMAQTTEIKIGVLSACPPLFETGPGR